ncbi:MAG TPA: hypothetical protein VF283_15440 [Bryobacteraceae bacterium]
MSTEKVLPKRKRTSEPQNLKEALRLLQEDAKASGTDKLTREEILQEIAAYRCR